MRLHTLLAAALCLILIPATLGQSRRWETVRFKTSGEAPGLDIEEWIKGEEVTLQAGRTYIVFFWKMNDQLSRMAFDPLTELQELRGDEGLTVIAITNDEIDDVRRFVRSHDKEMGFTVAIDRRDSTQRAWKAAIDSQEDVTGMSFVVDKKGTIQIFGHPMAAEYEEYLVRIIRGRFDATLEVEAEPRLKAARGARKTKTWRMAFRHYDEVIDLDPQVFAETALERFEMMLVDMEDRQEAYKYAREKLMGEHFTEDPGALAMLAEKIATDPKIPREARDLDVALDVAKAMMQLKSDRDPEACATMALVRYHRGELEEAVRLQKRAYFMARPKRKPDFKRVLEAYQEAVERVDHIDN